MAIYLAFAVALLNMASLRGARVLVTLQALDLGAQPVTVGWLGATFALAPVLLSWHAGRITDRFGALWPLVAGAGAGVLGLLLPFALTTLPALFVGVLLCGLGLTFYSLSLQNLVGVLSTPANRARNYSNYTMVISVAASIGPLVAGVAIDHAGHAFTFLLLTALLGVAIVLLALWGRILPRGAAAHGPPQGISRILADRRYLPVLLGSSIAQSGLELFQIYMPVYGHEQGLSASAIGVIIAMAAVGGFAARFALTWLVARASEAAVLAGALVLGAASFFATPFCSNAIVLAGIAFAFGAGLNCSQPITLIQIFNRAAAGRTGEVLGVRFTMDNVARLVSPVLFGLLASGFGTGAVFWGNAILLGAGGVLARIDAARGAAPPKS